MESKNIVGGDL